jgi:hypothetical protein
MNEWAGGWARGGWSHRFPVRTASGLGLEQANAPWFGAAGITKKLETPGFSATSDEVTKLNPTAEKGSFE